MDSPLKLEFDADTIRPLIAEIVAETVARIDEQRARLGDRLAFTEPEAAALLGIPWHSLRDIRRRGEIDASKAGRRIIYARDALIKYLKENKWST